MNRLIIILTSLCPLTMLGQNQLGLRTSNYSGTNSNLLNPSAYHSSPLTWDVNLISAGAFLYNQYAFVENASVLDILGGNQEIVSSRSLTEGEVKNPNNLYYSFYNHNRPFSNSINVFATGPSVQFRLHKFSVGLFTNSRLAFSATKLDADLDYFSMDEWPIGQTRQINPFVLAGMAWGEVGINLATTLQKDLKREITAGINLKYLMGFEGFYFRNAGTTTVTSFEDNMQVDGAPLEYAYTPGFIGSSLGQNGHGAGIDVGFTYIRRGAKAKPYKWKFGASLVDIGFIQFNNGSQKHRFNTEEVYDIADNNLNGQGLNELAQNLSEEVYGNSSQSLVAQDFALLTPSALSIQFDYALSQNWFINATANRRFNLHPIALDRENFWSVSARYENRWFEFGVPVVLYDDRHLRVGTWVRLWMLTICSDHVNSLLFKQPQLAGSDIYFALRINSPSNPFKKSSKRKNGSNGFEDCYF